MEHLKLFHRDVLTVRSHQWKYYVEPYSGCPMQCTYCLYWESPEFIERLLPPRVAERTRNAYLRAGDAHKNVYSPDVDLILEEMSRQRGIFRFGLPAVYQMIYDFELVDGVRVAR